MSFCRSCNADMRLPHPMPLQAIIAGSRHPETSCRPGLYASEATPRPLQHAVPRLGIKK